MDRRLIFTAQEFREAFIKAKEEINESQIDYSGLVEDLLTNSEILRGKGEEYYYFTHLTLQEYLAAEWLAELVEKKGWDGEIEIKDKKVTVGTFIDKKAWLPRFRNVITLFVGLLKNEKIVQTIIHDLCISWHDDFFKYRCSLGISCLMEINKDLLSSLSDYLKIICNQVHYFWVELTQRGILNASPYLTKALRELAIINCEFRDGLGFKEWLIGSSFSLLVNRNAPEGLRDTAMSLIIAISSIPFEDHIINLLMDIYFNEKSSENIVALMILGCVLEGKNHKRFVDHLLFFTEKDSELFSIDEKRASIYIQLLGKIPGKKANREVFDRLIDLSYSENYEFRQHAIKGLSYAKIYDEKILIETLTRCINDELFINKWLLVDAIQRLAHHIPPKELFFMLIDLLTNEDPDVEWYAFGSLMSNITRFQQSDILIELLSTMRMDVISYSKVAVSLGFLGKILISDYEARLLLMSFLVQPSSMIRGNALRSLDTLTSWFKWTPDEYFLRLLLEMSKREEGNNKQVVFSILESISGQQSFSDQRVFDCFLEFVSDENDIVRALCALGLGNYNLIDQKMSEEINNGLKTLVDDPIIDVRIRAIEALLKYENQPNEFLINSILKFIENEEELLRTKSFYLVSEYQKKFGPNSNLTFALIIKLLMDWSEECRKSAAETFRSLGEMGFRILGFLPYKIKCEHVKDLADFDKKIEFPQDKPLSESYSN